MTSEPSEVLTLFHCPGCEINGFAGDAEPCDHPQGEKGDQLKCHRCGTRLSAVNFYDYVNTEVVEYAE